MFQVMKGNTFSAGPSNYGDVSREGDTPENPIQIREDDYSDSDSIYTGIGSGWRNTFVMGESSNAQGKCTCDDTKECPFPIKCKDIKFEIDDEDTYLNTIYDPYQYNGEQFSWGDPYGPMFNVYPPSNHKLNDEYGPNPPAQNNDEEDDGYFAGIDQEEEEEEEEMEEEEEEMEEEEEEMGEEEEEDHHAGVGNIHDMGMDNEEEEEEEEEEVEQDVMEVEEPDYIPAPEIPNLMPLAEEDDNNLDANGLLPDPFASSDEECSSGLTVDDTMEDPYVISAAGYRDLQRHHEEMRAEIIRLRGLGGGGPAGGPAE